jgi:hypothetical protein
MHDINPLGTTMHLRELDRRTAPTFRAVPSRKPAGSKAPSIRVRLGKVLREHYSEQRRSDDVFELGGKRRECVAPRPPSDRYGRGRPGRKAS